MSTAAVMTEPGKEDRMWQIAVLFLIDISMMLTALICSDSKDSICRVLQLAAVYLHIPLGIWIGIIITKSFRDKGLVVTYWLSVAAPVIVFVSPYILLPLGLFFPLGLGPTCIFIQWAIIIGILSKRFTKGRWPLPTAILITLAGVAFIIFNLTFETTEFGPLGMLFANMFATPVFLLVPALLRIPASPEVMWYLKQSQYTTYGSVVLFWIVFVVRSFSA